MATSYMYITDSAPLCALVEKNRACFSKKKGNEFIGLLHGWLEAVEVSYFRGPFTLNCPHSLMPMLACSSKVNMDNYV